MLSCQPVCQTLKRSGAVVVLGLAFSLLVGQARPGHTQQADPLSEAYALYRLGDLGQAVSLLQNLVQQQPQNLQVQLLLGVSLSERAQGQDLPDALIAFRHAQTLDPKNFLAWFGEGEVLAAQKRPQMARHAFERALAIRPGDPATETELGRLQLQLRKARVAQAYFEAALRADNGYLPAHYELGRLLLRRGQTNEALAHFQESINGPDYAEGQLGMGLCLQALGKLSDAIDHYHWALAIDPQLWEAHLALGQILAQQAALGHPELREPAADHLQAVLQAQPGNKAAKQALRSLRRLPKPAGPGGTAA